MPKKSLDGTEECVLLLEDICLCREQTELALQHLIHNYLGFLGTSPHGWILVIGSSKSGPL